MRVGDACGRDDDVDDDDAIRSILTSISSRAYGTCRIYANRTRSLSDDDAGFTLLRVHVCMCKAFSNTGYITVTARNSFAAHVRDPSACVCVRFL